MPNLQALTSILLFQAVVSLTTVAQGPMSGIDEPRNVVIRTTEEWQTLWTFHQPDQPVPAVDFGRDAVIGVFLGSRPTPGYSVVITAIQSRDGTAVVEYAERRPDPDRMVAQVLTSPFHLVRVTRLIGPVEFKKTGDAR